MKKLTKREKNRLIQLLNKSDLTPEQLLEQAERKRQEELQSKLDACQTIEEMYSIAPEQYGYKLPENGSWIMVKISPPTKIKVPRWSFWFAIPDTAHFKQKGWYKIKIITPEGELCLVPGEYSIIDDMDKYLQFLDKELEIKYLSENSGLDTDKLFYLMSRGINKRDATLLMIKDLRTQHFCYFQIKKEYRQYLNKIF